MRDYDDHVRPHVVLRRIIIVVAVLTAVPVALWTVTGLIRTYVGPPKVPSFRQLATSVTEQQENTAASGAAGDWSLWQSVTTFVRVHVGALPDSFDPPTYGDHHRQRQRGAGSERPVVAAG